ncbi:hypothetical protein [uncultured Ilyobacter sp.]|uniref:hypothetical protein n=1 Tax=uncultured Ilyobacter sp. TaxID=544433 RepID=UPI002AA8D5AA|nr:hypothetical protein [uncultured Ilyobacter sp.]
MSFEFQVAGLIQERTCTQPPYRVQEATATMKHLMLWMSREPRTVAHKGDKKYIYFLDI